MSEVEQALLRQSEQWLAILAALPASPSTRLPKRIVLFGLGSSCFAAHLLRHSLMAYPRMKPVEILADSSVEMASQFPWRKGDWAIALSHRGKSEVTLRAARRANQAQARVIWVCGQGAPAPRFATVILRTTPLERCEPHTQSMTGAICAVSAWLLGKPVQSEWRKLAQLPRPKMEDLRRQTVLAPEPKLILGERIGEWLARETALKLMEMARLPVRAFGSEEFFHGPHWSTGPADSIWWVDQSSDARSAEIRQRGQGVRYFPMPSSARLSAWIPLLVEFQWSALAVALNRGVNPDDPRSIAN